jgi:hypothetical protein
VQAQKDGSFVDADMDATPDDIDMDGAPDVDDYVGFNADVLFEKDLKGSGVLDIEGAFYKYSGDGEPLKLSWLGLVSYLTPNKVGPGKIQPLVRVQGSSLEPSGSATAVDLQVGYVIADYAARLALGYEFAKVGSGLNNKNNMIYLGAQLFK